MNIFRRFRNFLIKNEDGGWISLDAIGGLTTYLLLFPLLAYLIWQGITWFQQRTVAWHLNLVVAAAREYGRTHAPELLAQATAASGPALTITDLQAANLLQNVSERNGWGQGYQIHVRQPEDGALRLIVLTTGGTRDGTSFFNSTVPGPAAIAGGHAGFIPSGVLPGQNSGQLVGTMGGWRIVLADCGIPSPGEGHLGALTDFSADELAGEFLYRVAVPGKPELNEMWTELDMTDHAIRNVAEVQFTPHELEEDFCLDAGNEGRTFLDEEQGLYLCRNGHAEILADTGNSRLFKDARLVANVEHFRAGMMAAGFDIKPTQSAICAVMLYDAKLSQDFAARLQEEGVFVTGFYYPVVPKGQARIRVQVSAGHTVEQLDRCIAAFVKVGRELNVLQ